LTIHFEEVPFSYTYIFTRIFEILDMSYEVIVGRRSVALPQKVHVGDDRAQSVRIHHDRFISMTGTTWLHRARGKAVRGPNPVKLEEQTEFGS
jgi:hypothetical protein